MKRTFQLAFGLLACMAASGAVAADMSVPPIKAAPFATYNWTGCYVGVHAGGQGIRDGLAGTWADGAILGGQLGCNYQIEHLVVGIEGEAAWTNAQATVTPTPKSFKNTWDSDVAVRLGLAFDHFLIYEKQGISWERYGFATGVANFSANYTIPGFVWGIGFEYAFAPQWTAKFETDMIISRATDLTLVSGAGALLANDNAVTVQSKIGVNYKF